MLNGSIPLNIEGFIEEVLDIRTFDNPKPDIYVFTGFFRTNPEEGSDRLMEKLSPFGYKAAIRRKEDDLFEIIVFKEPERSPQRVWVHIILFLLTFFSTLYIGALYEGVNPAQDIFLILKGLPFSLALLAILGSHELGHYYFSKKHRLDASLPYFIPFPSFVGTLGAFIRIRSPIPSRKALLDIGIAGPLTGMTVAVPLTIIGLKLSKFQMVTGDGITLYFGSSFLFGFLSSLLKNTPPPGMALILHPIAFAGWIGFFVTALNLIPMGQLDGGHIAYALLGRHHKKVSMATFFILVLMAKLWPGWLIWAILGFLIGFGHPPPLNEISTLDKGRKLLAVFAFLILILTFTPAPFKIQ
jgi:membrane-associated protease RseP (regulator of RpoE activity)